jgi:hypothetical protein
VVLAAKKYKAQRFDDATGEAYEEDGELLFTLNRMSEDQSYIVPQPADVVFGAYTEDVPAGFGIAPFLKASAILKFIFETKEGYTLRWGSRADNPIAQLVALHNSVDVLRHGYLQYRHLLPDCTVEDFVAAIEGMFCGKFVLDSKKSEVTFTYFNDYLDYAGARPAPAAPYAPHPDTRLNGAYKQPRLELLPYATQAPAAEHRAKSAIRLSMAKHMGEAGDSFYLAPRVATSAPYFTEEAALSYTPIIDWMGDEDGRYPRCEYLVWGILVENGTPVSPNTFDCYRGVEGGASVDVALPCEHVLTSWSYEAWQESPYYIFGVSYKNSVIASGGQEEQKASVPLAFCCACTYHDSRTGLHKTRGATQGNYRERAEGSAVQNVITLRLHRPDGLFNVYHALRDEMLRSGGYRITVPIDSSLAVDERELYTLNGQKVLVEKVTETLGEHPKQEVVLQTIKSYEDGDNA